MLKYIPMTFALFALALSTTVSAAPVVLSASGSDAASIQATVDSFRAALGDPNNGSVPASFPDGRREINWDGGGGNSATTPPDPVTPFDTFLNIRGARFTTPGSGLTQTPLIADPAAFPPGGLVGLFLNPTYETTFSAFSQLRLFVPVDSNIIEGTFFIPGSAGTVPATVSGFGAVFTDVDLPNTTQIEFFDTAGDLLFSSFVPPGTASDGSLSFLGVSFDAGEGIARVRITAGNAALGPNDGGGIDVVALDDFLYAEPQVVVPEPATWALFGIGAMGLVAIQHYRRVRKV
jgi:hypothetical protein